MQYSFVPEWTNQDAVMLTWPHQLTDWKPFLKDVEPVYVTLCEYITQVQHVVIIANDEKLKSHINKLLVAANIDMEKVLFVVAPCNDTWARDHGPITLKNDEGSVKVCNFTFNGWGNKYASDLDNQINSALHAQLCPVDVQIEDIDFVLEGGGIEVNEHNVLLTTSECLLNENRNPNFNKSQVEAKLKSTLNVSQVLWLEHGFLAGDDTDSHIDTLARFAPNNTIVYVSCNDASDEHYIELQKMKAQLSSFKTADGSPYNLVSLPWPKAVFNAEGDRLPATYANYLIINKTVLVPIYGDENDPIAVEQVQKAYPNHTVCGIDCSAIIEQFGSLHCITMQLPQGFLKR